VPTTKDRTQLSEHGLAPAGRIHWNLAPAELIEHAVLAGEGQLSADGSFVAVTAPHTGRSPNDKYTVREPTSEADIWWGDVNVPLSVEHFEALRHDLLAIPERQDDLYVQDVIAGADPAVPAEREGGDAQRVALGVRRTTCSSSRRGAARAVRGGLHRAARP
jgi:phosphoenolpyruvate carboxykinase (ATP)